MVTQAEKAERLKALHDGTELFLIPNPWDVVTARLLGSLGAKALTTTSAGLAWAIGKADGGVTREQSLANAKLVVEAVDLPVAADLENGFGHRPEDAAETIRQAAAVGLVGGSIEDFSGDELKAIYDLGHAVERVAAAAQAARALPFPFQFVARAENFLHGVTDLDATIKRLQAYEKAGADVLFAPGLPSLDAIRTVCQSVGKPVNVIANPNFTLAQLAEAGVRRVSVGGGLSRIALGAVRDAAIELLTAGTFSSASRGMQGKDINALMD